MSAGQKTLLHLNLDDAWDLHELEIETVDLRPWGPRLRFSAPPREVARFVQGEETEFAPFLIYGSGDFHYLTALWLRRLPRLTTVISFDNHPDWDVRPPKWGCGSWVNRALELGQIEKVSVWGCGNFECWWPARITGNNRAEREGRLEVHPWADNRTSHEQNRRGAILSHNWREKFATFIDELGKAEVYVTIDLDCLRAEDAVTNWEAGRFTVDDIVWALGFLRAKTQIVAGDICGAWSLPRYARWKQGFASRMDHPKVPKPSLELAKQTNLHTLRRLLPHLIDSAASPKL